MQKLCPLQIDPTGQTSSGGPVDIKQKLAGKTWLVCIWPKVAVQTNILYLKKVLLREDFIYYLPMFGGLIHKRRTPPPPTVRGF